MNDGARGGHRWAAVWARLVDPVASITDPAVRRKARLLAAFLLVLTGTFLAADVAFVLTVSGYFPPWYGYLFMVSAYALVRTGRYPAAAGLVLAMFPAVALAFVAGGGALDPVVTLGYLVLGLLLASILVSTRGVVALALANTAVMVALPLMSPEVVPDPIRLVGPLTTNAMAAVLAIFYTYHRNQIEADRQAKLRADEERLRLALESADMVPWELCLRTRTVEPTPALHAILGIAPSDVPLSVQTYLERVHPDDLAAARGALAQSLGGTARRLELGVRIVRPDGAIRFVEVYGRVVHDEGDVPGRVLGLVVDVSARHLLEEQLRQSQKMEAIGRMAGGVAHDFNNLLAVIRGNVELIRLDHDLRELDEIDVASRSAASLVRQLLTFSRQESVAPRVVAPGEVLAAATQMLRRIIGDDVEVELQVDPEAWAIRVDPAQVHQMLLNLSTNARDAMPGGGRLTIRTRNRTIDLGPADKGPTPGEWLEISVTDTGVGMSAETRARALEPFFTTKAPGDGTGLGLAMVFASVSRHGGFVEIDSEVHRGTTVRLSFPRAGSAPEPAEMPVVETRVGAGSVLLVEDNDEVRRLCARLLQRAGWHVHARASAAEALAGFGELDPAPDLLLTDIVMPGGNGPELARALLARAPGLRVLFMTGYAGQAVGGAEPLPGPVLRKPFSQAELARALRDLAGDAGAARSRAG